MKKILRILGIFLGINTVAMIAQPVPLVHGYTLIEQYHGMIRSYVSPRSYRRLAHRVATVRETIAGLAEYNYIDDQLVYNLMTEIYKEYGPATAEMPFFYHWQANLQPHTHRTCGYHAIANAVAVQHIIDNDLELTEDNIKNFAAPIVAQRPNNNGTTDADLKRLANNYGLENLYLIGYSERNQNIYSIGTYAAWYLLGEVSVAYKSPELRPRLMHFICNPPDHWTLVSLISMPGRQPFMVYLDSGNARIEKGSQMHKMASQLYNMFFA